jgi:hypothetical protein
MLSIFNTGRHKKNKRSTDFHETYIQCAEHSYVKDKVVSVLN